MSRTLPLLFVALHLPATAQYYEQNFDGPSWNPLEYTIEPTPGNLWQVGPPQKALFNAAHSSPNVIVTDTVNLCPPGSNSSFTVKVPIWGFQWYPVFFLRFYHAFDMDTAHAGGYMEVSWDNGATWIDAFDDWMMPLEVEIYDTGTLQPVIADTLSNGYTGFTGSTGGATTGSSWIYTSFCWTNIGFPVGDSLFMRFTYYSDSLAAPGEGWMVDDIVAEAYMTHPVIAYTMMDDYFKVAPNPVTDRLMIIYDLDDEQNDVFLALYDAGGRLVRVLRDGVLPRGVDHILLMRDELPASDGMLILRGHICERSCEQRIVLAH